MQVLQLAIGNAPVKLPEYLSMDGYVRVIFTAVIVKTIGTTWVEVTTVSKRGQWVSPVEVEGVLLRSPQVTAVAVVEDHDEHSLPCPCAFIIKQGLECDSAALEEELRDKCRYALPRFKQPRRYIFTNELPYTATGKIQRFKLREKLRNNRRRTES